MRTSIAGFECIVENEGTSKHAQTNCVVLFHGFGADFSDLAPLAEFLDEHGDWTWIFPNGPHKVDLGYHMTGRAWFPISMAELEQTVATGTPKDYATITARPPDEVLNDLKVFIEDLKKQYKGIVLGGFSQGGMIATHLFDVTGDALKGALLLSTVLLNAERLVPIIEKTKPKPFFQSHGSRDPVLHIKFGQALYSKLKKAGWPASWAEFPGGHEIPMPVLVKAREFLKSLNS